MPILRQETELSPAGIFGLSESSFPWWVAHVRSRQEKALARHLLPFEVPFYLPQREKQVRRSGRTLVSYHPLFPGYLFFRGSVAARNTALRSNLVVKVLEVGDQALLSSELLQIRRLQEAGASLVPYLDVVPGDAVRVTDGPFKGHFGVVVRVQGRTRLLVSISMLRQAVAVEFDRDVVTFAGDGVVLRRKIQRAAVS